MAIARTEEMEKENRKRALRALAEIGEAANERSGDVVVVKANNSSNDIQETTTTTEEKKEAITSSTIVVVPREAAVPKT